MQPSKDGVTKEEAERVLEEKKVFLDLIEGFEGLPWLNFVLTPPLDSLLP